jgi:DNA topoisomerase-1
MRTDSTTLSDTALTAGPAGDRAAVRAGVPHRQAAGVRQEVEERAGGARGDPPAGDTWRSPDQLRGELRADQLRLYELIWQRTLASQMPDARGNTVTSGSRRRTTTDVATEWTASGRTITFPGWQAAYGYGGDDDADESGDDSAKLPALTEGQALPDPDLEAAGAHHPAAPSLHRGHAGEDAREKGIGRPSTYASIMQTIQDRGYVWKKGQALVPTTDAFAVVALLEQHFSHLVDYEFTARMEDDLDEIAGGRQQRVPVAPPVLVRQRDPGREGAQGQGAGGGRRRGDQHDPARRRRDGELIVIRNGRYGPYLRRGDDTASIPEDLPLDELTIDRAVEILSAPKGGEPLGDGSGDRLPVFAKSGRFGPYVQLGDADTLPPTQKPKMSSLFQTMTLSTLTLDEALQLPALPAHVGAHPGTARDRRGQRAVRALREVGRGDPQPRERGAAAHGQRRRRRDAPRRAEEVRSPSRRAAPRRCGSWATTRSPRSPSW